MLGGMITKDKQLLGGTPVFSGTRVPVHALWEYLSAGEPLDVFLADFPSVSKAQALLILQTAETSLLHAHTH